MLVVKFFTCFCRCLDSRTRLFASDIILNLYTDVASVFMQLLTFFKGGLYNTFLSYRNHGTLDQVEKLYIAAAVFLFIVCVSAPPRKGKKTNFLLVLVSNVSVDRSKKKPGYGAGVLCNNVITYNNVDIAVKGNQSINQSIFLFNIPDK
jgi:hypothetical protein